MNKRKDLYKHILNCLGDASMAAIELESQEDKALGFMLDSVLKLAHVLYENDCPLNAMCDFQKFEQKVYERNNNFLRVIK